MFVLQTFADKKKKLDKSTDFEVKQKAENDKCHNRSRRFVNISRRYNFNSISELIFQR